MDSTANPEKRVEEPAQVTMVEVGARDGLQNEAAFVPTAVKIELIERLAEAGLNVIEAASFVSPKWVPQMADGSAVMAGIRRKPGVRYPVLVPNLQGFSAAHAAGADDISVFVAATESFSKNNANCSIAEALARTRDIVLAARAEGMRVRGYLSCVLGCPYEGEVSADAVAGLAAQLQDFGCDEIALGDTIGVGTPDKTKMLIAAVAQRVPPSRLAAHFHDTYGLALANIHAALECGVATIDSSVAGLGGCPYAPGAAGNVASEDVLYLLKRMNIETGVDLDKLLAAGQFISEHLGRAPQSKVARALSSKRALPA